MKFTSMNTGVIFNLNIHDINIEHSSEGHAIPYGIFWLLGVWFSCLT